MGQQTAVSPRAVAASLGAPEAFELPVDDDGKIGMVDFHP
jgi:hypothetical protein